MVQDQSGLLGPYLTIAGSVFQADGQAGQASAAAPDGHPPASSWFLIVLFAPGVNWLVNLQASFATVHTMGHTAQHSTSEAC